MKDKTIYFNFYGVRVGVSSSDEQILSLISKDFSYFLAKSHYDKVDFSFSCHMQEIPWKIVPAMRARRQSKNSITYQQKHIRYNDYYGKLLSIYDYKKESCELFSPNLSKLHEVCYLVILSRVGKRMDLEGLHKIHAFGVSYNDTACIGMMPMKGGKSTLFTGLLTDDDVSIFSDDTPVISRGGKVLPFPIRIGVDNIPEELEIIDKETNRYSLQREYYGLKKLLAIGGVKNRIAGDYQDLILFNAYRSNLDKCLIRKRSKFSFIVPLVKHSVIGFGLPIIFEYFWEDGFSDFIKKTRIFISRLFSNLLMLSRSRCYTMDLTSNTKHNADVLIEFLKNANKLR